MGLKNWFNRKKKAAPAPVAAPATVPATTAPETLEPIKMNPVPIPGDMMTAGMVVVPDPDPYDAGKRGSEEDIRASYRKHFSNEEKFKLLKKGIIETAGDTTMQKTNGWVRLATYLECVEAGLAKAEDKENHLRQHAAFVLNDIVRAKLGQDDLAAGIDPHLSPRTRQNLLQAQRLLALSGKGLSEESRSKTLDLALRAATASNFDTAHIDLLIKAGADIHTDNDRPLANAVVEDHHKLAEYLISKYKADAKAAQTRAEAVYSQKSPREKFVAFLSARALEKMTPASFKAAAQQGGSYESKKPLQAKAIEIYQNSGDASLLAGFMAGYMAFKREDQAEAVLKDGYLEIAVKPMQALLQQSTDPHKTISDITAAMPACDRLMLCNLLLRQLCSKGATPALVRAVIAGGADVHTLAERPLINAVDNGHTDLAFILVREYGARISDAVLELQTWTGDRQKLKDRLYGLMAQEYNRLMQLHGPERLPVLGKQAVAAKRPAP